jgi:hypothetical protein
MIRRRWVFPCLLATVAVLLLLLGGAAVLRSQPEPAKRAGSAEEAVPQLLETVGLLGGLQLYQTYLNIGFIADGRTEGLYKDKEIKQLLDSILTPLEKVDQQLEKVSKIAQAKEDQEAVARLRKIAALLRQQGKDLEKFWASNKEADGARYEATRKQAWKEISSLLGLEKEKE